MKKTNAVRILESLGISFQTREYISSEDEFDAVSVAEKVGVEPEQVSKHWLQGTRKVLCLFL